MIDDPKKIIDCPGIKIEEPSIPGMPKELREGLDQSFSKIKDKQDLRVRRPAMVVPIMLNRFQRDTLKSICEKNGSTITDLIDQAINDFLKDKWLIECQSCDNKWRLMDLKEMYNPNLICPQCKAVQFWQHIPTEVINYSNKSDKPHF